MHPPLKLIKSVINCDFYSLELWGHMLFWAVVSSATVYIITGMVWAILATFGQSRWFKAASFFLFLLSAVWKILSTDAVACKHYY